MKRLAIDPSFEQPAVNADAEPGIGIGDVIRMLGRHKGFIAACTLACSLIAALFVFHQTPVYEATATLRIDAGRASSLGLNDLVASPQADNGDALHTEVAVLHSDGVAIRALNSLTPEEFRQYAGERQRELAISPGSRTLTPEQERMVSRFEASTGVKQQENTQLVDVTFRDKSPQLAATIVNKLLAAYSVQSSDSRDQAVAQLKTWLSGQMDGLRSQVEASQAKLAEFQQANNIIGTPDASNTTTDRLKLLNDALTSSQAARIGKEAQLRAAQSGNPAALAALFPNPKLQALQAEQGALYSHYAELATKFGPKYAPLAEVQRQMNAVDAEVANQAQSIRSQLQQEYQSAMGNEKMLQKEYDQQTQQAFAFNRNQAKYAVLQGQVTSARELYDTLQRKLQQASVDAQISGVNTSIVDNARVPLTPVEPKKALMILSGLILGLLIGISGAFLFEARSDSLQNLDQLQRVVHFRILATIPVLTGKPRRQERLEAHDNSGTALAVLESPTSAASEGYRRLRANLLSSGRDSMQTILVTSPLPGDDVTEAVVNLAVSLTRTGSRVLLIDADLRRPTLHKAFGFPNDIGLGNYLVGEDRNRRLIQPVTSQQNLCLLVAGHRPAYPGEALGSASFRALMEQWMDSYDYILVKTAPLLAVSDAVPLLGWFDATVLVVTFDGTPVTQLVQTRTLLQQARASVAGIVVQNVPKGQLMQDAYGSDAETYYA